MPAKGQMKIVILGDHSHLDKSAKGAVKSLGGFAVGAAAAGAAAAAGLFQVGKTFDTMRDTIVVGTGASGKALDSLMASARAVGKVTPSSFEDIGTAIADVNTRLGLTGKPLEDMTAQFLNLSRITKTDLQTNIANVSRVFGDWSIATKDQSAALDKLFYTSQATGVGVDELADQVVKFGAPLRQFGFSFEESIALLGKWEKEGVNAQLVLAGMKSGLGKFSKAGKEPVKALTEITEKIKGAGSAGKANQIAIEAFGQRAGPDMAAAIREGRFEINDLIKGLQGSKGAISDADERTRSFGESWQIFKNKVLLVLEPIAARFFDMLSAGMSWISTNAVPIVMTIATTLRDVFGPAVQAVTGWISQNQDAISLLLSMVGGAIAGYLAYKGTVMLVTGAMKVWKAITTAQTIAQLALNLAMRANPIGIVITLVGALAGGIIYLWNKSAGFRNFFIGVWNGIKSAVGAVADAIGWVIDRIKDAIAWAKSLFDQIMSVVSNGNSLLGGLGIPGLATGGDAMAGNLYMVGERGRELFIPDTNGTVVPHAQTEQMMTQAQRDANATLSGIATSAAAAPASGGGAAFVQQTFNFPNYLGTKADLVREIRHGVRTAGRGSAERYLRPAVT